MGAGTGRPPPPVPGQGSAHASTHRARARRKRASGGSPQPLGPGSRRRPDGHAGVPNLCRGKGSVAVKVWRAAPPRPHPRRHGGSRVVPKSEQNCDGPQPVQSDSESEPRLSFFGPGTTTSESRKELKRRMNRGCEVQTPTPKVPWTPVTPNRQRASVDTSTWSVPGMGLPSGQGQWSPTPKTTLSPRLRHSPPQSILSKSRVFFLTVLPLTGQDPGQGQRTGTTFSYPSRTTPPPKKGGPFPPERSVQPLVSGED